MTAAAVVDQEIALKALADALETMAFVSPMPPEGEAPAPADAVFVTIRFTGTVEGTLRLATTRQFGAKMVVDLLGEASGDPEEQLRRADDFLKELINITCGLLVRRTVGNTDGCEMALPEITPIATPDAWAAFLGSPGVTHFEVEGFPLALHADC